MKLLVINPGSTSTKISVFEDETRLFEQSIFHDAPLLLSFPNVNDQVPMRKQVIIDVLKAGNFDIRDIDIFVGRGGSACPQPGGVTVISQKLYDDTAAGVGGSEHPAKLGVMLAWELGNEYGKPMYTMDPTNVDEFQELSRLTGIKGVYRNAQSHVLNQKAIGHFHAAKLGRRYEDMDLIIAHIDGGITVSAHKKGRMIDGNVGAGGDGAFTPTRIGSVPVLPLLDYIDAHSTADVRRMCSRAGGFVEHFGTADAKVIHKMVEDGDPKAVRVWNTMIYQVCKQIGAMAAVLKGHVEGILLTGGLVRYQDIVDGVKESCGWIADVSVYPGEREQEALAEGVMRVMRGEEVPNEYTGKPVWNGFED